MQLQPKRPPGRTDRKAAAYAEEIGRLRAEGYTYETIREALADIGISLSTSALRREVCRLRCRAQSLGGTSRSRVATSAPPPPTVLPPGASGHDVAEAFFNTHIGNPLLRSKEAP